MSARLEPPPRTNVTIVGWNLETGGPEWATGGWQAKAMHTLLFELCLQPLCDEDETMFSVIFEVHPSLSPG